MKQSTIDGQTLFKGRRLNKRSRPELISCSASMTRMLDRDLEVISMKDQEIRLRGDRITVLEKENSQWVLTVNERDAIIRRGAEAIVSKEAALRQCVRDKDRAVSDCTAAENEVLERDESIRRLHIIYPFLCVLVATITGIAVTDDKWWLTLRHALGL